MRMKQEVIKEFQFLPGDFGEVSRCDPEADVVK